MKLKMKEKNQAVLGCFFVSMRIMAILVQNQAIIRWECTYCSANRPFDLLNADRMFWNPYASKRFCILRYYQLKATIISCCRIHIFNFFIQHLSSNYLKIL